jgi:CO dehydrogenase/acetyl-CoA synthase gamma subunit (corrinoid Fe-S protein)
MRLMTSTSVMRVLMSSGVSAKVDHRDLIIPGLCAGAERQIEMMTKWKVKVGPRSGFELPLYLSKRR